MMFNLNSSMQQIMAFLKYGNVSSSLGQELILVCPGHFQSLAIQKSGYYGKCTSLVNTGSVMRFQPMITLLSKKALLKICFEKKIGRFL